MGPLNPRDILNTLIEGNARFAAGRLIERNISIAHRYNLLKKQRPTIKSRIHSDAAFLLFPSDEVMSERVLDEEPSF